MTNSSEGKQIELAIECVRTKWASSPVFDLQLYGENAVTLHVAGASNCHNAEDITREPAQRELRGVIERFNRILEICPRILELTGKKQAKFC